MKQLYTLLILLIPFVGFGQDSKSDINMNSFVLSQQIDNQDLFANQMIQSKTLNLIGLTSTVIGALTSTDALTYVGAGVCLVSYVIDFTSYKWLKKKNIKFKDAYFTNNHFSQFKVVGDETDRILVFSENEFKLGDEVIIKFKNGNKDSQIGFIDLIKDKKIVFKTEFVLENDLGISNKDSFSPIDNKKRFTQSTIKLKKIFSIKKVMSNFNRRNK